jgi:hypothetical protein
LAGRQIEHAAVNRAWRRHAEPRQIFARRSRIDLAGETVSSQQRIELGAEEKSAGCEPGIIQRLDAEGVARDKKPPFPVIPDGEREHAAETGQAIFLPVGIGLQEHFRVAVGFECVSGLLEFGSEFAVIVDGAVENQGVAAVGGLHRLMAVRGIENGQAAHAKGSLMDRGVAFIIGPAVNHRRTHAPDCLRPGFGGFAGAHEAGYAAHGVKTASFAWSLPARKQRPGELRAKGPIRMRLGFIPQPEKT